MKRLMAVTHSLKHRLGAILVAALATVAMLAACPGPKAAQAAPEEAGVEARDVAVYVNEKLLVFDVPPRIYKDRILVPMRAIFEELGAEVTWEQAERRIVAKRGWLTVDLKIGKSEASLNSELTPAMDVAPVIVDDRTLVPVRFIAESLGAHVRWDNATRSAHITMPAERDADSALAHPHATISDAPADFRLAPEGAPEGGTFGFAPIDISKVILATDNTSLYVKVVLNGAIPTKPVTAEGFNEVNGLKLRIALNTDRNTATGVAADKGAEAVLTYNVNLSAGRETASFFTAFASEPTSATPTGTAFGNAAEAKYSRHRIGRLVEGGMGSNYVVLAYFLEDLGLEKGSQFDVYACAAASTPNWSAFSFDEAPNVDQKEAVTVTIPY